MKVLLGFVLVLAGLSAVSYLQKRFDEADLRKALKAIQNKFPELTDCQAAMLSRFKGDVRVNCGTRTWTVNVVQGVFHDPDASH